MGRLRVNAMSGIVSRWGSIAVAGVLAMAVGGGIVAVATPGSNGNIHACYVKGIGLLRVVDTDAGDTCKAAETSLSWSANAGGPVAYGLVTLVGTVDPSRSMGLDDSMVLLGGEGAGADEYCFDLPVPVKNVMVTLADAPPNGTSPRVSLGTNGGCATSTDFSVRIMDPNGLSKDAAFYVLVH